MRFERLFKLHSAADREMQDQDEIAESNTRPPRKRGFGNKCRVISSSSESSDDENPEEYKSPSKKRKIECPATAPEEEVSQGFIHHLSDKPSTPMNEDLHYDNANKLIELTSRITEQKKRIGSIKLLLIEEGRELLTLQNEKFTIQMKDQVGLDDEVDKLINWVNRRPLEENLSPVICERKSDGSLKLVYQEEEERPTAFMNALSSGPNPISPKPEAEIRHVQDGPPPNAHLLDVWEWDELTGDPIPEPVLIVNGVQQRGWKRYIPETFRTPSSCFDSTLPKSKVYKGFIRFMEDNEMQTWTHHFSGGSKYTRKTHKRSFISLLSVANIKKIKLTPSASGKSYEIEKTNWKLTPWSESPSRYKNLVKGRKAPILKDAIDNININGRYGTYGPGSYWCGKCVELKNSMSESPMVKWGPEPDQIFYPMKRFTCCSNNVVYLIHCASCLTKGLWTNYIGETYQSTKNGFHVRCRIHVNYFGQKSMREIFSSTKDPNFKLKVAEVMRNVNDNERFDFMRDVAVHFNGLDSHTVDDRRYTLLDGNFDSDSDRKRSERLWIIKCRGYEFHMDTATGNLNRC